MNKFLMFLYNLAKRLADWLYGLIDWDDDKPDPEIPEWWGWWTKPKSEWPRKVEVAPGTWVRVGYVTIRKDLRKVPLLSDNPTSRPPTAVAEPYENENLRPTSDPNNTDSMRIIAKGGKVLMVWYHGDDYHYGAPMPFSERFDSDTPHYRIMEQTGVVDNITVEDVEGLPILWLRVSDVDLELNYVP